jgi:hypothetical protein
MSFDGAQIVGIVGAGGTLVGGIGMAVINGLFSSRGHTHKVNMETITMLESQLQASDARRRKALKRVDELEKTVHIHHDVIRVANYELSVLLIHDGLPDDILHMLEKVRDKLDTRIR